MVWRIYYLLYLKNVAHESQSKFRKDEYNFFVKTVLLFDLNL